MSLLPSLLRFSVWRSQRAGPVAGYGCLEWEMLLKSSGIFGKRLSLYHHNSCIKQRGKRMDGVEGEAWVHTLSEAFRTVDDIERG